LRLVFEDISVLERKQLNPGELKIGQISAVHGRAALDSAEAAIRGALAGEFAAVVAAPHSETAIHAAGVEFDGYPSFVARVAGLPPEHGVLMLCFEYEGREIRIAHVTLPRQRQALPGDDHRRARSENPPRRRCRLEKTRHSKTQDRGQRRQSACVRRRGRKVDPSRTGSRARDGMRVDGPIGADTLLQRAATTLTSSCCTTRGT